MRGGDRRGGTTWLSWRKEEREGDEERGEDGRD